MKPLKTDWDVYYKKPSAISSITRKFTEKKLLQLFKKYLGDKKDIRIAELGGANSCFCPAIQKQIHPVNYCVIDNNSFGLDLFLKKHVNDPGIQAINADALNIKPDPAFDLVFSVGLIEHFNEADTKKVIEAHFAMLKEGGICLITFPTPTLLYVIARKLAELAGIWIFFDERPLQFKEVLSTVKNKGTLVHQEINWPVILTQGIVVLVK